MAGMRKEVALVTGAGRGIGRAIAVALSREGVDLILIGRHERRLAEVSDRVKKLGGKVETHCCDFSDTKVLVRLMKTVSEGHPTIDLLVNNAGCYLEAPVEQIRLAAWESMLRMNLTAPFVICQAVLPGMYRKRRGRVVNIASMSGLVGHYRQTAYCTVKHGMVGFARSLSIEAKAHGVHVHTICPGGVRTSFFEGSFLASSLSGQTMLEPENVAQAVLYLRSLPDNVDIPELILRRCHFDSHVDI